MTNERFPLLNKIAKVLHYLGYVMLICSGFVFIAWLIVMKEIMGERFSLFAASVFGILIFFNFFFFSLFIFTSSELIRLLLAIEKNTRSKNGYEKEDFQVEQGKIAQTKIPTSNINIPDKIMPEKPKIICPGCGKEFTSILGSHRCSRCGYYITESK